MNALTGMSEARGAATHAMLPQANHDELVEQLFVRDLKIFVGTALEAPEREAAATVAAALGGPGSNHGAGQLRERMLERESFRAWLGLRRQSQRHLWDAVSASVSRQADALAAQAATLPSAGGSLTLDPDFEAPAYLTDADVHLMPGGYARDDGSLGQGALMDRGGAVFMLGRNGGFLNDVRGHTAMSHVLTCYPDLAPRRILELGCGVGTSAVPAAQAFPEAEVHGLDVGASMLRYAHARAESLGAPIHFHQGSAEHAPFPDGHFDLVYSCVTLHETSQAAVGAILAESRRLLRPGGVALHLEVPLMTPEGDLWEELTAELEAEYNNEPYWKGALSADYGALMRAAGFDEVKIGYQRASTDPRGVKGAFMPESEGVFRSWFIASGRA